jgi:hypothetical protein
MTVSELLKTMGVPLHVQVWLDKFARGDEYALEKFGSGDDPDGCRDPTLATVAVKYIRSGCPN